MSTIEIRTFSTMPEIGAGWGFDPGTVLEAVGETARSRRANEGAPVGAYDVAADLENIF